ncbi:MAG: hypothetical protein ACOC0U_07460 [Desulfovibrionales bacterium]
MEKSRHQIRLNPAAIVRKLSAAAILLIIASIGVQFSKFILGHGSLKGLVQLLYLDGEKNIPTYFSVMLLVFSSLILAGISVLKWNRREPYLFHWALLSFGFLFMSYDEAFQVHEKLSFPLEHAGLGFFHFSWVIIGIGLVLVLGFLFLPFVLHLSSKFRTLFLLAAFLYLSGAIGMEMIGGWYVANHGNGFGYSMIVVLEEGFEMFGIIFFLWSLLKYCAEKFPYIGIMFSHHQQEISPGISTAPHQS